MPYRRGVGYGPYRGAGGQVRWQEGHQYQMRRREDYGARHLSQDFFSAPGAITLVHAIRSPWSAAEHSPHRHQERARYDSCQQNNFTEAPGGHPSRRDHPRSNMWGFQWRTVRLPDEVRWKICTGDELGSSGSSTRCFRQGSH